MDDSKRIGKKSAENSSNYKVKRRKNHILVIGIGKYQEVSPLKYPVQECKELTEALIRHYEFEPEPRRALFDEDATWDTIYTELYNLDDLTDNDNLILIFSGHGFYDQAKDVGYWVPVDGGKPRMKDGKLTNPTVLRNYISISNIIDNLNTVKAHHIILIVDSCFAGKFTRLNLQAPDGAYNKENMPAGELPSRWALTSGLIEKVPDKSLFAEALLDILKKNEDEVLELDFLSASVKRKIKKLGPYSPSLSGLIEARYRGGEFVFCRRKKTLEAALEISKELLLTGSLQYLHRLETGRFKILLISDLLLPHLKNKWLDTSVLTEKEKEALPLQKAIEELWQRDQPHAILLGSGGTGKTVSFIRWWREWRKKQAGPIPLFIALNEYNAYPEEEREQFIFRYINRNYLSGQSFSEAISDKLWALFAGNAGNTPSFIFLLDGFNEVTVNKALLLKEMQELIARAQGLQLLVASRQDINIDWARQFNRITFEPVHPSHIRRYLKSAGVSEMPEKSSFLTLLGNPMMLTIYAGTSEWAMKQEKKFNAFFRFKTKVTSSGELLWNFVEAQLAKHEENNPGDERGLAWKTFLLHHLLPYLGYRMVEKGQFYFLTRQEREEELGFTQVVNEAYRWFERKEMFRFYPVFEPYQEQLKTNLTNDDIPALEARSRDIRIELVDHLSMLVRESNSLRFLHQNFRDFFAAVFVQRDMEMARARNQDQPPRKRKFPVSLQKAPLDFYVRQLLGELEGEHTNKIENVGGKWSWSRGQFFLENNLAGLLEHCRSIFDENQLGYIVWNLLTIWKEQRGELSGANLQRLFFSRFSFHDLRVSRPNLHTNFSHSLLFKENLFATGHSSGIQSVDISPDGRYLITGSDDKTAKVWDYKTGSCLLTLIGHSSSIQSVDISPDGRYLVTGSDDETAKVWDYITSQCKFTLVGHSDRVSSVSYSPDGAYIITGSYDGTVKVWLAADGREIATLKSFDRRKCHSVAFSPDGQEIVSGWHHEKIKIWKLRKATGINRNRSLLTFSSRLTLLDKVGSIRSVVYSPDGHNILSGSSGPSVRIWNAKTGETLVMLTGHRYLVSSVAYSPDGKIFLTGSQDSTVKLWNAETGTCLLTLDGHSLDVNDVVFGPTGRYFLTGSSDQTAKYWDVMTGNCLLTLGSKSNKTTFVGSNVEGNQIFTGAEDGTVKMWDTKSAKCLSILTGHSSKIRSITSSFNGQWILTGSSDQTARLWNPISGICEKILKGHWRSINCVAFSPDGNRILTGSYDDLAKVWDTETGECLTTLTGHFGSVECGTFSPDGGLVLTGSYDDLAKVWDTETGECLTTLTGHSGSIGCGTFSPDGSLVLTGSHDNLAKVWDTETGECLLTLEGHSSSIDCISFSPDGMHILTGSSDQTIKYWDTNTGECIQTLTGFNSSIASISFVKNRGAWLVLSMASNDVIQIWHIQKIRTTAYLWIEAQPAGLSLSNSDRFFIQGCDFRNLHPDSKLFQENIAVLRQYGGIFNDEDAMQWAKLME